MNGTSASSSPVPQGEPIRYKQGTAKASKIGLFSGKEKKRLNFENDPTGRFAVGIRGIFEGKDAQKINDLWKKDKENRKWVPVKVGNDFFQVEIASIAKRLGKSEREIIADYKNRDQATDRTKLDFDFETRVINYNQGMDAIKSKLETFWVYLDPKKNIDIKAHNAFNDLINLHKLKDPELLALCKKYSKQITNFTTSYEIGESDKARDKRYKAILEVLENFVSDLPEEAITEERLETLNKSFKDHPIEYRNALKLKNSSGDEHYRICLVKPDDDGKYAVRIEERTYPGRPKTDSTYVPYTENGKVWVRIRIASLRERFSIPQKEIKEAAEDYSGNKLRQLIETRRQDIETTFPVNKEDELQVNEDELQVNKDKLQVIKDEQDIIAYMKKHIPETESCLEEILPHARQLAEKGVYVSGNRLKNRFHPALSLSLSFVKGVTTVDSLKKGLDQLVG